MMSQPPVPGRYHFVYQYFYRTGQGFATDLLTNIFYTPFFWMDLIGLPLFLGIAGFLLAKKEEKSFFLPFAAIWIMVSIFSFELDGSDANKLFMYVFLMLCIFSGYVFADLYKRGLAWKAIAIVLVLANIANFAAVYGYWATRPLPWFSSAEFNASSFVFHNTSSSSLFAVSDFNSLQQPVSGLGSRQTLISMYPYVEVDEYTLPLAQLISENERILSTGNCTLAKSLNVSYVYILTSFANDTAPFSNSNFTLVFTEPDPLRAASIYIYRAQC